MPAPENSSRQLSQDQEELAASAEAASRALREQIDLLNKLAKASKSAADPKPGNDQAKALAEQRKQLQQTLAFTNPTTAAVRSLGGAMSAAASSTTTAGEVLGRLGSVAGAIPGPAGAAAGAILGFVGSLVDIVSGPFLRSQQVARAAYLDVATGARSLQQALDKVKLDTLQEGLERLVHFQQGPAQALQNLGLGQWVQTAQNQSIAQTVAQAAQRSGMLRQLEADPQIRALRQATAQQTAGTRLAEQGTGAYASAYGTHTGNAAYASGRTSAEAADLAQRNRFVEEVAVQTRGVGETLDDARTRVRTSFAGVVTVLEQQQRNLRAVNFAREALERNQTPAERAARRVRGLREAGDQLSPEQQGRESLAIFEELRDGVEGALNRLPQAFLEGSQEAAVAVAAAQREQRGNDPQTQMVAILSALREQGEQRRRLAEDARDALRQIQQGGQPL